MGVALTLGCRVGKDYERPELKIPSQYRNELDSTDTDSVRRIDWVNFFEDHALRTLIDSAIIHNYDMQRAVKNIQIAEQRLLQSKAAKLPEIGANIGSVTKQWRSENYYSSASSRYYTKKGKEPPSSMYVQQSQWQSGIQLDWEIDIWGKVSRQNESTLAEYLETREARQWLETQLVAEVADRYYNLLMLDAQILVAKSNVALSDSTLKMVKLQWDAGLVTSLAVEQIETQRLVAAALVPDLEQEIALQENALMALTGKMPDSVFRSATALLSVDQLNDSLSVGVPLELVRFRPDIRGAELALRSANASVGVAQAYRYPSLKIHAAGGVNSIMAESWFNIPGSLFGTFIGGISQPIFQRRKLKTQYEVALLERDKAELDFQKQVLDAVNDVTNALITIQKLNERYKIGEEKVNTTRRAVKNAALLFRSGLATYLEVITAQSNALESELDLVVLKQRRMAARIQLYRALGGGWH